MTINIHHIVSLVTLKYIICDDSTSRQTCLKSNYIAKTSEFDIKTDTIESWTS